MTPTPGSVGKLPTEGSEIVAAIDEIDGQPHLVIANIARDGAWISVPRDEAASLPDWE
ncbi:DUF7556 family protein [Halobiforma nitratireducens]|uniref:DUF7556 family protein n=1 Tax=Halobiforma nitratireducens TaxID=130048 RepID=UPI0014616505|nr:hypothetical protein [Halobiforma nitratireducens]